MEEELRTHFRIYEVFNIYFVRRYYAFCMRNGNGAIQTLMFKCPYENFEIFDVKTKACKFNCKAKGTFQNPAECQEYFYCSGANAQPVLGTCPANWVFDGTGCNKNIDKCQHPPQDPEIENSVEDLVVVVDDSQSE